MGIIKKVVFIFLALFLFALVGNILSYNPTGRATEPLSEEKTQTTEATTVQQQKEEKYSTVGDTIKRDNYEIKLTRYSKDYINEKYYNDQDYLYYNTSFIHFEYEAKVIDLSKEALGAFFIGQFRPNLFDTTTEKLYGMPISDYDIWTHGGGFGIDAGKGEGSVYLNKKDKHTGVYTRIGLSEINYPTKVIITSDCSYEDFDTLAEIEAIEQGDKCPITYIFTVY